MARLNEPMVSTDSVDTLRRKFLRQNRDIARINSTQSLKIRTLENECVRLLSENLDLRGQILRLQTELEDSRAQKIADHALEIKERMEAQLVEWGAMLASLGHEPTPRSRSPREPKKAKRRSSIGRTSMSEWRRRDTMSSMKDLEAAALQEGRLPPIWENKACPRETLSREEILALRSIVDESTESPDLGPPPVSRFVDEDPVKIDLPGRSTSAISERSSSIEKASPQPEVRSEPPPPTPPQVDEKKPQRANEAMRVDIEPREGKTATTTESQPTTQAIKAGLKRKLREEDEKENVVVSKPPAQLVAATKDQREKIANVKARPINRPIKLPSNRRDVRDKLADSTTQRRPLGAKNSNENIQSPKKTAKPQMLEEVTKDAPKPKKANISPPVEIPGPPSPQPVSTTNVEIEPETLSADPNLVVPDTPEPVPREEVRDTPPPADISARGETSRGSRRARAAVSYAEPNLRDKMRRPTKQLLDAVAGEGKHIRRSSQSKKDELPSCPSSIKSEEKPMSWKDIPAKPTADLAASPLAQKGLRASPAEDVSVSMVTDRKKRNSAITVQGTGDSEFSSSSSGRNNTNVKSSSRTATNRRLEEIAAREEEVAKLFDGDEDGPDVYEFTSSSPRDGPKKQRLPPASEEPGKRMAGGRGARRSRSRRQSSMVGEDMDTDTAMEESQQQQKQQHHRGSGEKGQQSRPTRRASAMATSRIADTESAGHDSSSLMDGDSSLSAYSNGSSASSADADASAARDRVSARRRSMML